MKKENRLFCLHCSKPLVGRQKKFCGDAHRQAFKRKRGQPDTDQTTAQTDRTTENAVVLFETAKRDLARAEGMVVTLENEREALRHERDHLINRIGELERKNGSLEGKLEVIEATAKEKRVSAETRIEELTKPATAPASSKSPVPSWLWLVIGIVATVLFVAVALGLIYLLSGV